MKRNITSYITVKQQLAEVYILLSIVFQGARTVIGNQ